MNFGQNLWNKVFCRMLGLVVIEVMTSSGHLSNINEITISSLLIFWFLSTCSWDGSFVPNSSVLIECFTRFSNSSSEQFSKQNTNLNRKRNCSTTILSDQHYLYLVSFLTIATEYRLFLFFLLFIYLLFFYFFRYKASQYSHCVCWRRNWKEKSRSS